MPTADWLIRRVCVGEVEEYMVIRMIMAAGKVIVVVSVDRNV